MQPLDKELTDAVQNAAPVIRNSLHEHFMVLLRTGVISLLAGFVGGTVAFFLSWHQRTETMTRKGLCIYYISKVATGCLSAYLAVLAIPILGLTVSLETEQLVSVLAAILGSDFIAFLVHRIFGEHFKIRSLPLDEEEDKQPEGAKNV